MPDLITRAKSVPVPIAKFHYRNPPSPQLQHKSPFGQRSKSSGSSGCLRTVTCWHLSNHLVTLAAGSAHRCIAFTSEFMPLVPAFHKVIVGSEAIRVFPGQARDLGLSQFAGRPPSVPAMDC